MPIKQLFYFVLCGGTAAGLNWGSRFLFSQFVSFEVAVVMAFFVGLISGFILMQIFVFESGRRPLVHQMGYYIVVNIFALLQTFFISLLLARWLFPNIGVVAHAESFAHLVGVLVPVISSYLGHKFLTFR